MDDMSNRWYEQWMIWAIDDMSNEWFEQWMRWTMDEMDEMNNGWNDHDGWDNENSG